MVIAHTNTSILGRLKVAWPDLGYDAGAGLETAIHSAVGKISDHQNSRFFEYTSVADSTLTAIDHNFGVALDELDVWIYTGAHPNLTRVADPASAGWTIVATTGSEKTSIDVTTPGSGGPHTFAVVILNGSNPENVGDLDDVDTTTTPPEDGQALVWDATGQEFIPGASGDASFKVQGVTDPNAVIKGGYIILPDGRELASYDGAGTTSGDYGGDLTINLDTVLGSNPVDATAYYLYIDLDTLGSAQVLTDNGRSLYSIQEANFALLTDIPETTLNSRYIPIGFIRSADTGTVWSGTGAALGTLAFRRHDNSPVAVVPTIYERSLATVGAIGTGSQIAAGHHLQTDSFNFTPADDLAFYNLRTNGNDDSGETSCSSGAAACNLTDVGTPTYNGVNMFGTTEALELDGSTDALTSTDTFFNGGDIDYTFATWVKLDDWSPVTGGYIFSVGDQDDDFIFLFVGTDGGLLARWYNSGSLVLTIAPPTTNPIDGSWHHVAMTWEAATNIGSLYIDGELAQSAIASGDIGASTTNRFTIGAVRNSGDTGFAEWMPAGDISNFVAARELLDANDIRKLYSYRVDHNKNVSPENQIWLGQWQSADGFLDAPAPIAERITDVGANSVWWDLTPFSADKLQISMQSTQLSPKIVSIGSYDSGLQSTKTLFGDPTPSNIAHGLACIPAYETWYEGQNVASMYNNRDDLCDVDSTNIRCDVTGLTIGGSNRFRVKASCADGAAAIDIASAGAQGIADIDQRVFIHYTTTGDTLTNSAYTNLNYDTKVIDQGCSGDCVTTGSIWKFTAPRDGFYHVKAALNLSGTTDWAQGEVLYLGWKLNAASASDTATEVFQRGQPNPDAGSSPNWFASSMGSTTVKLSANDTVSIHIFQNSGASRTLDTSNLFSYVKITEIGAANTLINP